MGNNLLHAGRTQRGLASSPKRGSQGRRKLQKLPYISASQVPVSRSVKKPGPWGWQQLVELSFRAKDPPQRLLQEGKRVTLAYFQGLKGGLRVGPNNPILGMVTNQCLLPLQVCLEKQTKTK